MLLGRAIASGTALALLALAPIAAADPFSDLTDAVGAAVGAAQGAIVAANGAANDALGAAAAAPGAVTPTVWHAYGNAATVPRVVGDYAQARTTGLADLDGPVLRDFAETLGPHLDTLGGAVSVTFAIQSPIGGEPNLGVTPNLDYDVADAEALAADGAAWAGRSVVTAEAWTAREAAATAALPDAVVAALTA